MSMPETNTFTPLHNLMPLKSIDAWANYWDRCGLSASVHVRDYPGYIHTLIAQIRSSNARRLFLMSEDRCLFLAGLIAGFYAGVPVVLPPSNAPGLLKDLKREGDVLLSDQQDIPNAISLKPTSLDLDKTPTFPPLDPNKTQLIFYTSGSTGDPQAIHKTLRQLEAEVATLEETWGGSALSSIPIGVQFVDSETRVEPRSVHLVREDAEDPMLSKTHRLKHDGYIFVSTVPHHHIYGLLFSLLWPVCGGYPLHSTTFSYWEELLAHTKDNCTIISSPSHLSRIPVKSPLKAQYIFSSGAPLPFESAQSAHDALGTLPTEVYGSTETGGIAHRQQSSGDQPWTKFSSVDLKCGTDMRLSVCSPYLPSDSFFQTEDRVEIINSETFKLLGRADRIAKIEGKRVSLLDMEKRLQALEEVEASAVIALDDTFRDEVGAIIVLSKTAQVTLENLGKVQFTRLLREKLSLHFEPVTLPRRWRFVSEIPTNDIGKRIYSDLKSTFKRAA